MFEELPEVEFVFNIIVRVIIGVCVCIVSVLFFPIFLTIMFFKLLINFICNINNPKDMIRIMKNDL